MLCYHWSQDTSIGHLPYVIGPETENALATRFGQLPTLQQLSDLDPTQLEALDVSSQVRHRIKALKILAIRLAPNAVKLDTIKAICTCPLTLEVVKHGVMVSCCGAVFEKTSIFSVVQGSIRAPCPLCRRSISMSQILQTPQQTAIDRIVQTLNDT